MADQAELWEFDLPRVRKLARGEYGTKSLIDVAISKARNIPHSDAFLPL